MREWECELEPSTSQSLYLRSGIVCESSADDNFWWDSSSFQWGLLLQCLLLVYFRDSRELYITLYTIPLFLKLLQTEVYSRVQNSAETRFCCRLYCFRSRLSWCLPASFEFTCIVSWLCRAVLFLLVRYRMRLKYGILGVLDQERELLHHLIQASLQKTRTGNEDMQYKPQQSENSVSASCCTPL
jgi:hypothetical protein